MSRVITWAVLLLCTLVLVIQSTDAHVHLCFDGQEPSVAVHIENGGDVSGHLAKVGQDHRDLDIDIGVNSSFKSAKVILPMHVMIFAGLLLAMLLVGKPPLARARSTRFRYLSPAFFSPPLRGPPSFSVH